MSRAKLLAIGAASASTGAGIALLYSSSQQKVQQPKASPPASQAASGVAEIGIKALPSESQPSVSAPIIAPKALTTEPSTPLQIIPKTLDPFPVEPAGILKYGSPGPIADELKTLAQFGAYDRRTRNPIWLAEHITAESVAQSAGKRSNSAFREDKSIPVEFRARMNDYFRSGYDRGHQVPAGDASWSQQAMDDTFKLSNMCPQVGEGFNRHYWARFENFCRILTERYPSVRVITGPLYLPKKDEDGKWRVSYEVIGTPPNIAVPTHFYKIIYGEDGETRDGVQHKVAVGAFVLPNARIDNKTPLEDFEVDVNIVERASGLEFGRELEAENTSRLCEEIKCDVSVKDFREALAKPKL